jgi:hypothetical protein
VSNVLSITTTTLPSGNVNASYSQTLAAAGGSGTYTNWQITAGTSTLTALNLSLNTTTGVISGTPNATGTASFTVQVTDSASHTATQSLSIQSYSALSLPSPDPGSLPSTAFAGYAYNLGTFGSITGSGGSGNLSISVASGLPADGLSGSPSGATLNVSGTLSTAPAPPYTVTFSVTLTDTKTGNSITQAGYYVNVSAPTPVTLQTPSTSVPGSAVVNQSYTGSIQANNGVPPYTWSINGTIIGSSCYSLGNGTICATNSGGSTLSFSGTPTSATTIEPLTVKVVDSESPTTNASNSYSIVVNPAGGQIGGQFTLQNYCYNGSQTLPVTFTVTLTNTATNATIPGTTNSTGGFSFSSVPTGTYNITPSIAGAASLFYPASYTGVVVSNGTNMPSENFTAQVAYTVSGTVSYSGSQTGQTYLNLNGGCGTGSTGTGIATKGSYTIRGVQPGSYTLSAWMDPLGNDIANAIDPSGSTANGAVTVTNANVTGASVTLTDPTFTTPTENPGISAIIPNSQGVMIEFNPSENSNSVEDANEYVVQWSTSSTLSSSGTNVGQFSTIAGSHTFAATGDKGVWIINDAVLAGSGYSLTAGKTYYFQAQSVNTLASTTHPSGWTDYESSSNLVGTEVDTPLCTGTCTAVTSSITIPAGLTCPTNSSVAICPGAPLYLGLIQLSSSGNPSGIYATVITSPVVGANGFTITVPSGSNYFVFGVLDQLSNGGFGVGSVNNTQQSIVGTLTISGSSQTVPGNTLPATNSLATVTTQYNSNTCQNCSSTQTSYQLNFEVQESNRLPVAVTLSSGPNLINTAGTVAIDMSDSCTGNCNTFQYSATLPGGAPNVGDKYGFTVTYSDGTVETGSVVNGAVTAFGSTGAVVGPSDLPTNLLPSVTASNDTPTFTWTDPTLTDPGSYWYSFDLSSQNCNGNCTIWQIPVYSKTNIFPYTITSITWGTDPTGGGSTPSVSSLSSGGTYNWSIGIADGKHPANGAQASVYFATYAGPLTLPATNPSGLPPAVYNVPYNGTVTASGGYPPYQYLVTGSACYGCNPITLTNGLVVTDAHDNTLVVGGTPTSTGTVTFQATVKDSSGATYGPVTYTIQVNNETPVSLPAAGSLGTVDINQPFTTYINAAGGDRTNYQWTVNGVSVPWSGTPQAMSDGITVWNTAGSTLSIGGTPTAAGTVTLNVSVVDVGTGETAGPVAYTIAVINPSAGYNVSGTVTYSGLQTGWVYLSLSPTNNCNNNGCNNPNPGTAISSTTLASGGTFTIHGVQPGTYTLQAWMDTLGYGVGNVSDPSGSTSVTVTNSTLSGVSFSMHDSGPVTLTSAPQWTPDEGYGAFSGGAMVYFGSILNNNSVQIPTSYILEYSTDSTFNTGVSSKSFPAAHADHHWIVTGLTNGSTYYFRAAGVVVNGSSAVTGPWSPASPSGGLTIGAPSGPNTVQGTVTFSQAPTGPLYVAFLDYETNIIYTEEITNPVSPQAYSINLPNSSNYGFFAILDQENAGWNAQGDISNYGGNGPAPVSVTSSMSGVNLTLPSGNSFDTLTTQHWTQIYNYGSHGTQTYSGYNLNNSIDPLNKRPVAVELLSGPNVVAPEDLAVCGYCNTLSKFNSTFNPSATPTVGDTYAFQVTYSDGTSETLSPKVSGVVGLPINLSPVGNGSNTTPTFTWTDPANASSYLYQFGLSDDVGNTLWWIGTGWGGFPSTTTQINWGTNPAGNTSPASSVSSLTPGSLYNWWVWAYDPNGNLSQTYVDYVPDYTPLALPAPNPSTLGTAVATQSYNGTIAVTGGYGPYYWSVNGCQWNCTGVSLGSGLYASNLNYGSNILTISGTPNSTSPVSFQVYVYDSTWSTPTATYTYTIHVNENPLSLPAASPNPLPSGTINQSYNGAIISSGGSGSGYVWSINGSQVNTDGATPFVLSDGLNAYSNGPSLNITGTLGSTPQTITLNNVSVTDSANDIETPVTYTIAVINPSAGYNVSGTVTYSGSKTGWVYLALVPNNNNGGNQNLGTAINGTIASSLKSPGVAFTIHGVPAGTYTLQAWMDNIGYGAENASNPTGSLSSVTVTSGAVPGQAVTLADPAAVTLGIATPTWDPSNGSGAFNGGAVISFDPICNGGCGTTHFELPASYEVEYSTSSTFSSGVSSKCFPANGGNNPWIVSGLTNSQTYYFRAAGNVAAARRSA